MVQFAATAETVVRLKSGDPLIFGRAGEEIEALQRANIEVEIVPGVTAALAAAAAARISLTDRRTTEHLLLISAHHDTSKSETFPEYGLTDRTTVVVYMPGDYGRVAERLLRSRLSPDAPCMLVSKVSTENQQRYTTTLDQLGQAPRFPTPCLLIAGKTVAKGKLPAMDVLSVAALQDSVSESVLAL
jgi:uroporphyrin-III C-methyltransferase